MGGRRRRVEKEVETFLLRQYAFMHALGHANRTNYRQEACIPNALYRWGGHNLFFSRRRVPNDDSSTSTCLPYYSFPSRCIGTEGCHLSSSSSCTYAKTITTRYITTYHSAKPGSVNGGATCLTALLASNAPIIQTAHEMHTVVSSAPSSTPIKLISLAGQGCATTNG